MSLKEVTVSFVTNFRGAKKNGTTTILLCIYNKRKRYYISTRISVSDKNEFDKIIIGKRLTEEQAKIAERLTVIKKQANAVLDEMENQHQPFDFDIFKELIDPTPEANTTTDYKFVADAYKVKIGYLINNKQLKTAQTYTLACKSLTAANKTLKFTEVSPDWLKAWQKSMTDKGRSITTVSMYVRTLRTLFNDAIEMGYIDRDKYPFGKRKYKVPASENIKKALTIEQISKIYHYKCPNELQQEAKDYWLFLYLNNGMNVKDMAQLKQKDYQDGVITFVRAKTATTSKKIEPIQIPVSPDTKEIINKYGKRTLVENDYLFPILNNKMNTEQQMRAIAQTTQNINKNMAKIATALDIPKVTTYTARHSYATAMLRSGQSIAFIGKQLGHTDTKTTENYLKSFTLEATRKANEALTNF